MVIQKCLTMKQFAITVEEDLEKKANLEHHILSLHEGKMLSCEICSVEVPNEKIYNKHMEIHTAKETSYCLQNAQNRTEK